MSNSDTRAARDYHDLTKHSYWSVRSTPHYLDWSNRPSPFKVYPEIDPIPLPRDLIQTGTPALQAISSTGVEPAGQTRPNLEQVASLLYYSAGVTRQKNYPGGVIYFRAAACAGALYPVEVYLVCGDIEGLSAGVYHFSPGEFALRKLRDGDYRGFLSRATAAHPRIVSAPAIFLYTAITWRSSWKYRDRSYRYHFWDNGTILANMLAMASAHSLPAHLVMGFIEEEVNRLIGIDGRNELALSMLAVGHDGQSTQPILPVDHLPELRLETLPLSGSQVDYPSIIEMHAASSLYRTEEVEGWRQASVKEQSAKADGKLTGLALPPADDLPIRSIEEVIQRRASTRRFARRPMPFKDLSVILDHATRGIPADFLRSKGAHLNDLYLIVNDIEGIAPGAYFYNREERALELIKGGDYRDKAANLTLDQDLGGDASATIFFMADLGELLERFGNRGYRAAQMEAGIIGGKIYISAYTLGRGATGLTFYDDDVTEFFSPHAANKSCIFVTSTGIPGKKPIY